MTNMTMKMKWFSICLLAVCCLVIPVAAAESGDMPSITVSGTGSITTAPDEVIISAGVQTTHTDPVTAQQENAQKTSAVISALKGLGIASEDIKTSGYSMYSRTPDDDSIFAGKKEVYVVSNTVTVTSGDVSRAGEIIDTAVMSGANNVNSVRFTISDEKAQSLRAQALIAAVAQARGDADTLAGALGVTIIGVQDVTTYGSSTPMNYAADTMSFGGMESAKAYAPTPIEAGTLDVTATVNIVYGIQN
ncbi:SIMPL domain-containing protein [Methanogenium marinum]|uniref:SIMPL domain-containing protein n=1 Tax=Methanogenium marinum TaxID=348610 RepID=A0A9Q4KTK9_9EURY|nr:SIMPL domain-containing protein [Methanogenium marinum]MDE4908567.1 SIMPL domain-containing protein [Methanogenium marinum]